MRALSIQQPWAWAIVHSTKNVENRTRNIAGKRRGQIAIHASKQFDDGGMWDDLIQEAFSRLDSSWELEQQLLDCGVIIGVADLVDVHVETPTCCTSPWAQRVTRYDENPLHHLVLENRQALRTPIPATGHLGLWTVPVDLELRIGADLWIQEFRARGET